MEQVRRCTESGDAPGWQGATTENTGEYLREEQRRQAGCSAARMQMELLHGLFKPETRFSALRKKGFRRELGGADSSLTDGPQSYDVQSGRPPRRGLMAES